MEKDPVVLQIQEKLNPYVERIQQLESSISGKDEEIIILRLAVERLIDIKNQLSSSSEKKGGKTGKSGTSKTRSTRGGTKGKPRSKR